VRSHILINQVGLVHSGAIQRRSHLKLTKHSDDNKSLLIATSKPVAATMSAGGGPQKLGLWLTVSQCDRRFRATSATSSLSSLNWHRRLGNVICVILEKLARTTTSRWPEDAGKPNLDTRMC